MPSVVSRIRTLWRMSAVRQALASALLFLVLTAIVAAVAFAGLRSALVDRIDDSLLARAEAIMTTDEDEPDEVAEELVSAVINLHRLAISQGQEDLARPLAVLVGNRTVAGASLAAAPERPGHQTIEGLLPSEDEAYRVYVTDLGGLRLIVGESLEDTNEIVALVAGGLAWGGLATALAVLLGGVLLGLRNQRRISAIDTSFGLVAAGHLQTRLPVGQAGDDIDRLATSANTALGRLEDSVVALRDLSANIAHDLKTPIARLRNKLAKIAAETPPEEIDKIVDAIDEADAIAGTFDAVLRISQIEAGSRRDRFEPTDLGAVARAAVDLFDDPSEDAIQLQAPDSRVVIHADRELLIQLTTNLIGNAQKHGAAEEPVEVHVEAAPPRITVADHGPGIPEAERERVLERFYRLDRSRSTAGTGLGLSLAKAIANLHGAHIALADNNPGLKVTVTFPDPAP